jgi:O-antigen/teichoic acid export membrane protein
MSTTTVMKNAFANVCRGGSTALVMVLSPPFLTRILSADSYSTWLLVVQLSTYVSLLDFGIQTAIGRYVAYHNELGEIEERNRIVSTAFALLICLGLFAISGLFLMVEVLPYLFKDMPIALHRDAQISLFCIGGSLAISLPSSVFGGIFIGLQRYDIPAWIIGFTKLVGGVFVILVANSSHSIIAMSITMGLANLLCSVWLFLSYKKKFNDIKIDKNFINISSARKISSYCLGLSSWTLAMIMISGLDTTIVGYFDYKSIVYYGLAATLTNFVMGVQSSAIAAIMPLASSISAKKDSKLLGKLLISGTKYTTIIMILMSFPLILWGRWILFLWVGEDYANKTIDLFKLLLIGNGIRQIGAVYSTIVLATGEQRLIIFSPLFEGVINSITSVFATSRIGSIGVAIGTITGAISSILFHLFYNLPRTKNINVTTSILVIDAVLKPLFSITPIILFVILEHFVKVSKTYDIVFSLMAAVTCLFLLWTIGFSRDERRKIIISSYKIFPSFLTPK